MRVVSKRQRVRLLVCDRTDIFASASPVNYRRGHLPPGQSYDLELQVSSLGLQSELAYYCWSYRIVGVSVKVWG